MTGEKQFRLSKSRDRKWFGLRPRSFFILVISIVAVWTAPSAAEPPYTERDYMSERERQFHGTIAVVGETYHLSVVNSSFPTILTLVMSSKDKALHLEIKPEVKPASIVMSVSEPSAYRLLKPVWYDNNLQQPKRFWTNRYWIPMEECNVNGCPKISFRVTQGAVEITVLGKRRPYPPLSGD